MPPSPPNSASKIDRASFMFIPPPPAPPNPCSNASQPPQGRGTYTMQFDHYEELPPNVKEALMRGRGYAF